MKLCCNSVSHLQRCSNSNMTQTLLPFVMSPGLSNLVALQTVYLRKRTRFYSWRMQSRCRPTTALNPDAFQSSHPPKCAQCHFSHVAIEDGSAVCLCPQKKGSVCARSRSNAAALHLLCDVLRWRRFLHLRRYAGCNPTAASRCCVCVCFAMPLPLVCPAPAALRSCSAVALLCVT